MNLLLVEMREELCHGSALSFLMWIVAGFALFLSNCRFSSEHPKLVAIGGFNGSAFTRISSRDVRARDG